MKEQIKDRNENIPEEMKQYKSWILFNPKTKLPMQLNGDAAKPNDPTTWTTFDAVKDQPQIGFVFSKADPYTYIDMDKVINMDTLEVEQWAELMLNALNSYTEYGLNMHGFHCIVKANKPAERCRNGKYKGLEMYDGLKDHVTNPDGSITTGNRYTTMTGKRVSKHNKIFKRQAVIDKLYEKAFPPEEKKPEVKNQTVSITMDDEDIIHKCRNQVDSHKFISLYDSGDFNGYDSQSEADLDLCSKIAFYTKDSTQIDRIFKSGALYRPKWDTHPYYAQRTIQKAIDGSKTYDPEYYSTSASSTSISVAPSAAKSTGFRFYSGAEIMQMNIPPRKYYLDGIMPEAGIIYLHGESGVAKSLFCASLMSQLTFGMGMMKWENMLSNGDGSRVPIKCAYVDGEMTVHDWIERIPDFDLSRLLITNRFFTGSSIDLTQLDQQKDIMEWLVAKDIKVVCLDNVSCLCPGLDENSKKDWDVISQWQTHLRDIHGITQIWQHHTRKDGKSQSGTSARDRNADIIWYMNFPERYNADTDGVKFNMKFDKTRQKRTKAGLFAPMTVQLVDGVWTEVNSSEGSKMISAWVLKMMVEGKTYRFINDRLKEHDMHKGYSLAMLAKKKENFIQGEYIDEHKDITERGQGFVTKYRDEIDELEGRTQ